MFFGRFGFTTVLRGRILALGFALCGFCGCGLVFNNPVSTEGSTSNSATSAKFDPLALASLTYSHSYAYYAFGESIFPNYPGIEGGTATSWSIFPALPDGLVLDASTGIITGTPSEYASTATYTVTASGAQGSVETNIQITVGRGFKVNKRADISGSGSKADETCNDGTGNCTLRAAIEEAANSPNPPYIIMIPNNRYKVTLGALPLDKAVNIMGESQDGVLITGNDGSRLFDFTGNIDALVSHLHITQGQDSGGGAIRIIGGSLRVRHVTFYKNVSNADVGGAIECDDNSDAFPMDCTIQNSKFIGNDAGSHGGAISFRGDNLTIEDSVFKHNLLGSNLNGGALDIEHDSDGSVTIRRTHFKRNGVTGTGWGGAIYSRASNSAPVLIEDSLFEENEVVDGHGSAVLIYDNSDATIRNSTFVRNMNTSGATVTSYGAGRVIIEGSTFFNNLGAMAAINGNSSGTIVIRNNIFTHHVGPNTEICSETGGAGGTITNSGNNLFAKNSTDCKVGGSDIVSDPKVTGLSNWGGPLETVGLASDSPAINAANSTFCSSVDARGQSREGNCDIGALEFQSNSPPLKISFPRSWYTVALNRAMSPISPTTEGEVEGYSITPGLPVGLSLDPLTGVISGTPTQQLAGQEYIVRAKNNYGSTSTRLRLKALVAFDVDSTGSAGAAIPSDDGNCNDGSGNCTLPAAVEEANGTSSITGQEFLVLVPDNIYAFADRLTIAGNMTIIGTSKAGTIIDPALGTVPAIEVISEANLSIADLTLRGGERGIHGNYLRAVDVYANNVVVQNNAPGAGHGGGILLSTASHLEVENSTFDNNDPAAGGAEGGGIYGGGGGGSIIIRKSVFNDNDVDNRGAQIRATGLYLEVEESRFLNGNSNTAEGGAIRSTRAFVKDSAFISNTSGSLGGAIETASQYGSIIRNSTFNTNQGTRGGAISAESGGPSYVLQNTIAYSTATDVNHGALYNGGSTAILMFNNLFFDNQDGGGDTVNCNGVGTFSSANGNMTDRFDGVDCNFNVDDYVNETGIDLGVYLDSGTTGYFPLASTNEAIDKGFGSCSARDILGTLRPIDFADNGTKACDIGSFEAQ